jgi:predicted metal-dependent hydrolase
MSRKGERIAGLLDGLHGRELDAHYLGYFECFNRKLFYEAHDVLEQLWLAQRHGPNGAFYKGLIQLAGAFVHLQKERPAPAIALFKLALGNLDKYPAIHEKLEVESVRARIGEWLRAVSAGGPQPLANMPELKLLA